MQQRNVCITAVDGQTGFLITELLMTDPNFSRKADSITGLSLHPTSAKCKELTKMGGTIVPHKPGKMRDMVKTLKESGADTICFMFQPPLAPSARPESTHFHPCGRYRIFGP